MDYPASSKANNVFASRLRCSLLAGLLLLAMFINTALAANNQRIAVLYPEASTRVTQLYKNIIKNMQAHDNVQVQSREFAEDDPVLEIQQWLTEQKSQAVILLGKKGLNFSVKLKLDIPVITGAHVGVLPNQSAVSLTADPEQLFRRLKKLEPDIQQIHVIYNEKNSGWLIKKAQQAASKNNIKLNAIETNSVQASGKALKQLIQTLDSDRDAIWLPFDPILPIKPLLPDLLKKSWQKNIIIFSGNPYHVQQGVLFALFPDYTKLGKQLIDLAISKVNKNGSVRFEASQYLNSAINTRTASHLGIVISSNQKNNYKMVFPKN